MNKRKLRMSLTALFVVVVVISMMSMNVFAASQTIKPKYGVSKSTVTISTPYQYKWFWQSRKTMDVTVKNTGNCGMTITMKPLDRGCEYKLFQVRSLSRGNSARVYTLPYDNCRYEMTISYYSNSSFNRGATVTTTAGSLRIA